MSAVIVFAAGWKVCQVVRMGLVSNKIVLALLLFFVFVVDLGFDIDELKACVSLSPLAWTSLHY
jgi:hypothetical protein